MLRDLDFLPALRELADDVVLALGKQHQELGVVHEDANLVEDGRGLVDERFRYLPQAVPVEGRLMELARVLSDARSPDGDPGLGGRAPKSAASAGKAREAQPTKRTRQGKRKTKGKRTAYPRFFREGNALLKLGWSRKSRSEYEHRAPRESALAVAGRVAEVASRKNRFTVENLGDVRIAQGEEPISSCQVYLCVAWFRRTGLVVQHGRRGYSLPAAPARFPAKVKSARGELLER